MTWKQFWGICEHHWERLTEITVEGEFGGVWYKYVLQCNKCGKIKSVRI